MKIIQGIHDKRLVHFHSFIEHLYFTRHVTNLFQASHGAGAAKLEGGDEHKRDKNFREAVNAISTGQFRNNKFIIFMGKSIMYVVG